MPDLKPEEKARQKIDELLEAAGWIVQDLRQLNLGAGLGVAAREFPLKSGPADYVLFVERKAIGVLEAKPEGTTLSGVAEQSERYITAIPESLPHVKEPPRFAYESTGTETLFRDRSDPAPRSRRVFAFHRPETLQEWVSQESTLKANLKNLPPLITDGLWDCQIEAIQNLERSFAEARPRALIQMASGGGKTFTAISFIYRLIKFADAKRVLFLVDRKTLGKQTSQKFQEYATPDDGRKFTELYNVQYLTSNTLDPVSRVCITTIQRLYSMLKGEEEFDHEVEEHSLFDVSPMDKEPIPVDYNPQIPIENFDFIITDECHRSIYHLWRQVLEYFDAFIIGLTATPSKQTLGFFNQNLVTEYSHDRAVADGVNVPYDVYRIKTKITEEGSKVDAGYYVDKRDKLTRRVRWEQLDEELEYEAKQLDRDVVAPDQIRTVIKTFKDKLFTEIFPSRKDVPKTLVFAKDDSHAEDIVHCIREEFGKGNEFCKKITYKTMGEKTEDLIASFRNSPLPRIAVTVDMISTGTDIKPLECLIFMRDIKSRVYFEQMKGRGTRVILPTDLKAVTSDAFHKTHFVIVDAVGVCESDKTDSRPLERKRSVPFEKLITGVAMGIRDKDTLTSLAGRLARLDREIDEKDRKEIEAVAKGKSLKEIINTLLDALDPDKQFDKAKEIFKTKTPAGEQVKKACEELTKEACAPFDDPELRNTLIEIRKTDEQIIDNVTIDELIDAGHSEEAKEAAKKRIENFQKFIGENKDELTALQIIYNKPYGKRLLTYEQIDTLAKAIARPPLGLNEERIWRAYEHLEKSRVKGTRPDRILADMISLVRFAIGQNDILEPFHDTVEKRFEQWVSLQEKAGRTFTPQQMELLIMIKDHIATSASISIEDFELAPFHEKGGPVKAYQLFGDKLDDTLKELNEVLVA